MLNACSTTRLEGTWINPQYQRVDLQRVLVLGVMGNDTYQRLYEDSLSRALNRRGVLAEPGYALFPSRKRPSEEAMAGEIANKGYDTMLVSTVTDRRTEKIIVPGDGYYSWGPPYAPPYYSRRWYDFYTRSYDMIHQPDYIETYKILTVQSNLYDTKSEELIWSATTETLVDGEFGSKAQLWIDSLVDGLMKGLTESNLLYPR
jgi:hypothetical protein